MASEKQVAFKVAFERTLPIFAGFLFLGIAYGMMMTGLGFAPWMPILMAILIDAGSMEFLVVSMLLSIFNPLNAALMTLMVNGRHLFMAFLWWNPTGRLAPRRPI